VINVEYNQLDPLLRSQGDCKGDVADPSTGYSPYPGNANNIVIELGAYAKTLRGEDQGVVLEFVNPKYKDETRTDFKKPTRLECMMQDIPKLFQKELGNSVNIGFTMFDRWFTFSPAKVRTNINPYEFTRAHLCNTENLTWKSFFFFSFFQNSLESGVEAAEKGNNAPGTMSSAESDKYIQNQRKMKFSGVDVPVDDIDDLVPVAGIPVTSGPRIVLCPAFAVSQEEILEKIQGDDNKITKRSSLVLEGHNLSIKNLDLDGALVIRTGDDTHVSVDGLKVQNKGWELKENEAGTEYPETVAIRGYTMTKHETREYLLYEDGSYVIGEDGEVRKIE
jgi:UDP-sugar pyrophosphorylase